MNSKQRAKELLSDVGITLNGDATWDIQVHNEGLFDRVFSGGSLAIGESYMDGWWDVEDLAEFFSRLMRNVPLSMLGVGIIGQILKSKLMNLQSSRRAFQVGKSHYDIGNDLYRAMLGETLTYSCGYWRGAVNLKEAQEHKMDLICKKIGLKKGQRILDVGCGWGGGCSIRGGALWRIGSRSYCF